MTDIKIEPNLCKKLNIEVVYLFGSQVKGTDAVSSDFDIAVLFSNTFSSDELFRRTVTFAQELKTQYKCEFNIVALNNATSLLKYEVISHSKVLYSRNDQERINFEVGTVKVYIDDQHIREIYAQALQDRVSKGIYK